MQSFLCYRDIIRSAVNASVDDKVIFTGSGCTGAVHELVHALNIEPTETVSKSEYNSI